MNSLVLHDEDVDEFDGRTGNFVVVAATGVFFSFSTKSSLISSRSDCKLCENNQRYSIDRNDDDLAFFVGFIFSIDEE